jgi:elongation factor G
VQGLGESHPMRVGTLGSEPPSGERWTVARACSGEGKYVNYELEKYAHVRVVLARADDEKNRFEWQAPDEELPFSYMKAACRDGIVAALSEPLALGGHLAGVRISVVGGSYHDRETDEDSVRIAAALAVRDALSQARLIRM